MITGYVISLILKIIAPIVSLLPSVSIPLGSEYVETVMEWVSGIIYFLPMDSVLAIISLMLLLWVFRVVIAFLKMLWSILPLV